MASRHRILGMRLASLRCAFLASILVFLVLMVIAVAMTNLYGSHIKTRALKAVTDGLAVDLDHLRVQGDAVAENTTLKGFLIEGNSDKILGVISDERERRGIGLMGVANKDGIIISRTRSVDNRGENAFLVSPQGRAVVEGKRPASIEVSSFDPTQVIMTTGRPIVSGTSTVGALFANYLLDDVYSERFKKTYLFDGVQVSFYTKDLGLYGTSIRTEEERSVLNSYFNIDSDWIKRGKTGDIVQFDSGVYYHVENIVFPGLELNNSTGVLVFVPYYGYSVVVRTFIVIFALLTFIILAYHAHRATTKEQRNRYYYWTTASMFVLLIIIIYIINHAIFVRYVSLKRIPYILYNSTLRLQPDSGIFDANFDRPVSILVNTGDESINALSVHISFDPARVQIQDVDMEHSICSNVLEKAVDIANKEVRISCIVTSPGFSGPQGVIGDIIVHPLVTGDFSLSFDDHAQVLANDGLGTNVLRQTIDGSYHTVPPLATSTMKNKKSLPDENRSPIVFSPTHSNTSRWYNSSDVKFVWSAVAGDGYLYTFDQATGTIPRSGVRTTETKARVTASADGIYYFHVATVSGDRVGPTRHYQVMIDTTPPADVTIRSSQDEVNMGDVVRFEFAAQDVTSGLQNTMYIDLDNGTFLPVGRQTYVPFVDIGTIPVRLRVYDKAGNFTEIEKVVNVSGTILQSILRAR